MGINCRHLGLVRRLVKNPQTKKLILSEIVARALKNELRNLLRTKTEEIKLPIDTPYKVTATEYQQ